MLNSTDLQKYDVIIQANVGLIRLRKPHTIAVVTSIKPRWYFKIFGLKDPKPIQMVKAEGISVSVRFSYEDVDQILSSESVTVTRKDQVIYTTLGGKQSQ